MPTSPDTMTSTEPHRDRHQPEGSQRGHDTGAEFRVTEEAHRRALQLVEQNWLIEERLVETTVDRSGVAIISQVVFGVMFASSGSQGWGAETRRARRR